MTRRGGLDAFYPILPDAGWLARLVPLGIKCVQLRIKDAAPPTVAREIAEGLRVTRRHGCQLIVNDYWREAIDAGADYVHLGQEDLALADRAAIRAAGVRLGISTHSEEELAIALAAEPDYVALGPIHETTLKAMPWAPQGLDRLGFWKAAVGDLPLVAIGGMTLERAPPAIEAGACSVAVVGDVVSRPDPESRTRAWIAWARSLETGNCRGASIPRAGGIPFSLNSFSNEMN